MKRLVTIVMDRLRISSVDARTVCLWLPTSVSPLNPSWIHVRKWYSIKTEDGCSSWRYFRTSTRKRNNCNRQSRPVAYQQHIGSGYYVSVNDGFMCVDVRKYGVREGEEKPTQHSISLWLDGRGTQHSTPYPSDVSYSDDCYGMLCTRWSFESAWFHEVHIL